MKALLLSINPEHAGNILNGTKRYEFRKTRCREDVGRLFIYCTAPVKMVVGEARIADVIVGNPNDVWERTRDGAGISRGFFDEYYRGRGTAVAYELDGVRSYPEQKSLADYGFRRPPQSFAYVDCRD